MLKKYTLAFLVLCSLLLNTGCGLFKDSPEFEGIQITPDNTKIVYQYSVFHYTSYSNNGGIVNKTGYTKNYFDVYDAVTGKKLNEKPFEIQGNSQLLDITNSAILFRYYNLDNQKQEFKVYDINTGKLRYSSTDVSAKNAGINFAASYSYQASINQSGFTVDGDDARVYLLNDFSGSVRKLNENEYERTHKGGHHYSGRISYYHKDSVRVHIKGETRKKVVFEIKHEKDTFVIYKSSIPFPGLKNTERKYRQTIRTEEVITSGLDFIQPYMMGENRLAENSKSTDDYPFIYNNSLIISSNTKALNKYEWVFTCIPFNTDKESWTIKLNNPLSEIKSEEIKDAVISGNNMIILTDQSANSLNLNTGKWNWNVRLIQELGDD